MRFFLYIQFSKKKSSLQKHKKYLGGPHVANKDLENKIQNLKANNFRWWCFSTWLRCLQTMSYQRSSIAGKVIIVIEVIIAIFFITILITVEMLFSHNFYAFRNQINDTLDNGGEVKQRYAKV